jgi:hypothetical protein
MESTPVQTKPNGPVAASFVAAGIACLVFGIAICLVEFSPDFKDFLNFDKKFGLGSGVGPLSGKVTLGILALVISWAALHLMWRGKEVDFGRAFAAALVLAGLGFLLTFPPVFMAF